MSDAPPPIPNPAVHPGALRAPDIDYAKLEERVLASMVQNLPDIEAFDWQRDLLELISKQPRRWTPIEFGQHEVTGTLTAYFEDEKLLESLKKPTAQPNEPEVSNRKQRRIAEAKERRKPRGQRKRLIMDIETYDPNRTKDWLNG